MPRLKIVYARQLATRTNYCRRATLLDNHGSLRPSIPPLSFWGSHNQQIEALRSTAVYSANNNAKAFEAWQKHAEKLNSFIAVSNRRLDNLSQDISSQQSVVTQLHAEVLKATADLTTLQILMACAIFNITNFISALNEADNIRLAIKGLVHGQLSSIIFPPDAIEQTLTQIHSTLPYSLTCTGLYL